MTKIIETLQLDLDAHNRQIRYIRHIINSIAKDFLLSNKSKIFEAEFAVPKNINGLEGAMKLWKKQEAISKLHNLNRFIFASSQFEKLFID